MPLVDRHEAVGLLRQSHVELERLLAALSEDQLTAPATIGSGEWSAKDLIGHLCYWEELALGALEDWRRGRLSEAEQIFRSPSNGDEANARDVERKASLPPETVSRMERETFDSLLDQIDMMSDEEWRSRAPYPAERRTRLATLLGAILGAPGHPFGHAEFGHLPDLRAYQQATR